MELNVVSWKTLQRRAVLTRLDEVSPNLFFFVEIGKKIRHTSCSGGEQFQKMSSEDREQVTDIIRVAGPGEGFRNKIGQE